MAIMCMYVCMHVHMYLRTYMYICVCICVHVCVCVCVYVYMGQCMSAVAPGFPPPCPQDAHTHIPRTRVLVYCTRYMNIRKHDTILTPDLGPEPSLQIVN